MSVAFKKGFLALLVLLVTACGNEVKKEITIKDLVTSSIDYPLASTVSAERIHAIEQYQIYRKLNLKRTMVKP